MLNVNFIMSLKDFYEQVGYYNIIQIPIVLRQISKKNFNLKFENQCTAFTLCTASDLVRAQSFYIYLGASALLHNKLFSSHIKDR